MQVVRALTAGAVVALAASLAWRWFRGPRLTPILLVLAALAVASGQPFRSPTAVPDIDIGLFQPDSFVDGFLRNPVSIYNVSLKRPS